MSLPRPVIAKRTVLISRRCTQRQFLLTPSNKTNQAVLYCLGYAAQTYSVELHGTCVESDHHHTEATDHFGYLPDFLRCYHSLLAKLVNALYGRSENVWSTAQTSVVDLVSPEDAFRKLIYTITNPAKDHLVRLARDWPGVCSIKPELRDRTITVHRPSWLFDPETTTMPKTVTLRFTRPPGFAALSPSAWQERVNAAVADVERAAASHRDDTGRRIVGRKKLKKQLHSQRATSDTTIGGISPTVASKAPKQRVRELRARAQWRADYRRALERYRAGETTVLFPFGTYQLRVDGHVSVAPPPGPIPIPYAATLRDIA